MAFLIVSAVVVALSVASLWSELSSRRDFVGNRPHIDSLRDVTGIIDRNELVARFGPHNAQFHFQTDLKTALEKRLPIMKWLNVEADIATIAAVLAAQLLQQPIAWIVLGSAVVYCGMNWIVSFFLVWPHRGQFDDET